MSKQAKIIIFSCLYFLGITAYLSNIMLAAGLAAIAVLCFLYFSKQIFSFKFLIALFVIFIFGLINTNLHLNFDDDLTTLTDNQVTLKVKVLSIPSNNIENKTKFFAQVSSVSFDDIQRDNINAKTMVTVNDKREKLDNIKIGDILKITGKLKAPIPAANPSQFNYAGYLQHKNTFSLIYVYNEWEIISHAQDFKGRLLRKLNDTRNRILQIHKQNIQSPMIEVLGGIIFGDDAVNPDDDTKESFINSGIFHILAASGMNVTLIFSIWFFFAKSMRLNYRFSIITGIILILVYTCMTGFGPPIIRAFLMLTLILIGKLIDRSTPTLSLLFIVGLLMLLYNPLMILDIGFQLSFIVTFALILTAPLLIFNFKYKPVNYAVGACLIPVIAQIYAAPLQMYYFNTFALYSVFANIAIIPVLSIVSFIGFVSSILALIPFAADKICFCADFILNPFLIYIVKVADFFANLPNSIIFLKRPSLIQVILYFAAVITITCVFLIKEKRKPILITALIFMAGLLITFIPKISHNAEVIFFSVGNADAALIKSPQNKYYLIDTGKLPYGNSSSQAEYIIIKYLKDKGIKDIEGMILSHFDSDHAGGALDILKDLNVNKVYISDTYENTSLSARIINYLKENKINTNIISSDEMIIQEGEDFVLNLIKPQGAKIITENEKSIIVLLENKNNKVLFMGDGDINSYNALSDKYKQKITVMKSGHHGAINTINEEMLANTDLFIISTGINVYNHPHPQTITQLENAAKRYFRTDYHNAIKIIFSPKIKKQMYSPKTNKFITTD